MHFISDRLILIVIDHFQEYREITERSLDKLLNIPFIEMDLAQRILSERNRGDYRNLVDFQKRLRLDSELSSQLMHYLQF